DELDRVVAAALQRDAVAGLPGYVHRGDGAIGVRGGADVTARAREHRGAREAHCRCPTCVQLLRPGHDVRSGLLGPADTVDGLRPSGASRSGRPGSTDGASRTGCTGGAVCAVGSVGPGGALRARRALSTSLTGGALRTRRALSTSLAGLAGEALRTR